MQWFQTEIRLPQSNVKQSRTFSAFDFHSVAYTYHRSSQGNRLHSFSPVRTEHATVTQTIIPEDIQTNKSEYLHPFHHSHLQKWLAGQILQFRNGSPPHKMLRTFQDSYFWSCRKEVQTTEMFVLGMHVCVCVCVCHLLVFVPRSLGDPSCVWRFVWDWYWTRPTVGSTKAAIHKLYSGPLAHS